MDQKCFLLSNEMFIQVKFLDDFPCTGTRRCCTTRRCGCSAVWRTCRTGPTSGSLTSVSHQIIDSKVRSHVRCSPRWENAQMCVQLLMKILFEKIRQSPSDLFQTYSTVLPFFTLPIRSDLCIPRTETERPRSLFLHSSICERLHIYSRYRSTYSAAK